MTHTKQKTNPLRLFILVILLFLSCAWFLWERQKNTEQKTPEFNYKNLVAHIEEKGKQDTIVYIHDTFYKKDNDIPAQGLSDALRFLRTYQTQNDMDPEFGFLYAKLLRSSALSFKETNPNRYQDLLATAVLNFYASALLVEAEIARCKDPSAQEQARSFLENLYTFYYSHYGDLPRKYRESIRNTLSASKNHGLKRPPNPAHCKQGAKYMKKILETGQYTETEKFTNQDTGITVQMIESDIEPDYIPEADWKIIVEDIYNKTIQDLSNPVKEKE